MKTTNHSVGNTKTKLVTKIKEEFEDILQDPVRNGCTKFWSHRETTLNKLSSPSHNSWYFWNFKILLYSYGILCFFFSFFANCQILPFIAYRENPYHLLKIRCQFSSKPKILGGYYFWWNIIQLKQISLGIIYYQTLQQWNSVTKIKLHEYIYLDVLILGLLHTYIFGWLVLGHVNPCWVI